MQNDQIQMVNYIAANCLSDLKLEPSIDMGGMIGMEVSFHLSFNPDDLKALIGLEVEA